MLAKIKKLLTMKKITKILQAFVVIFGLSLMTNCTPNEIAHNKNADASDKAKIWFDNHKNDYNAIILQYIENLDWGNAIVSYGEIGEVIEVPFALKGSLQASNEKGTLYNDHHRLMFVKDEQNEFKLLYVQMFTNDEKYSIQNENYNYYNIRDNFNGYIYVQDLSTNIGNKIKFEDGEKVENSSTAKMQEYACVYFGWWSSDGSFTALYEVGCYGGGGGNGVPSSGSGENPGSGYGGGTSGSNPSSCPAGYRYKLGECVLVEVPIIVITDASFSNNPCLASVFAKLGGSATFQKYLRNFDGSFSVANLKLSASSTLGNNVNAETTSPINYLININFNENNLNRPALSIARTFIHEMIHAEIYRKLLSVAGQPQIQFNTNQLNQLRNDYPGLYDYYMRYEFNIAPGQNPSDAQHEAMATHYRSIIIQTLKQFDNTLTNETYEALAWEGLKNTVAWKKLSTEKQNNISSTISNFNSKNSNCQ